MSKVWSDLKKEYRSSSVLMRLVLICTAVFVVVHLLLLILPQVTSSHARSDVVFYLAASASARYMLWHPWTLLTHMFTHVDFMHWLSNMIALYFSGQLFLRYFTSRQMLAVYFTGGICGFAAYLLVFNLWPALSPESTIVGASACIMAVLVAIAAYAPNMQLALFGVLHMRLKYLAAVYVIYDFVSLRQGWNSGGHLAHLGGALFGFAWARSALGGKNLTNPMERLLAAGHRLLQQPRRAKSKSRMNVVHMDEEFNRNKKLREQRTDAILDKISRSGYDSLTKEEKDFLFRQSQK